MKLGTKLISLRKQNGLRQTDLGDLLNVSYKTVQRWEADKTSPRREELQKLAEVLKVPVAELLSDSPTPAPVMQVIPTQEKSTQETNTGMAALILGNGYRAEAPATPEGYAFLKELFLASRVAAPAATV